MPPSKAPPRPDEERYHTDAEVGDALRNLVVMMRTWERLRGFKDTRGKTLREFVEQHVSILTSEVMTEDESKAMSAELTLAMVASGLLILYKYSPEATVNMKNLFKILIRG